MRKSVKFAVSIPDEEFEQLESLRKNTGLTRSQFIREAIKLWREEKEKQRLIEIYVEGYRKIPENLAAAEAWERASLSAFAPEEW